MIKISLRYPYSENGRFDIDYYVNKHAPWARMLMGAALKGFEIEHGVSGREPGSDPTYVAIANLYFDSVDDPMNQMQLKSKATFPITLISSPLCKSVR